jgi:hypothetical protein
MQLPLQLAVASLMDIDALEALDPELIDPALDLVPIEARALNYPATYQTYHHQID